MATKIPNIVKIQSITAVGKNAQAEKLRETVRSMERECTQNIKKAAKAGETSTMCDSWISEGFVTTLRAGGYGVEFVDTLDDGEGGRLSSLDANYPPHFTVSWAAK